jgi:hypothetical protein
VTSPNAAFAAARKGVGLSWTVALFKPLASTQRTLTYTMHTPKATIAKATLLLNTLSPASVTGQAPAKSASAVAQAQAAAGAAAAKVESDVAALQLKAAGSSGGGHSSGGSKPRRSGSASAHRGAHRTDKNRRGFTPPSLSFGTSPQALSAMDSRISTLGRAVRTFTASVGTATHGSSTSTTGSIQSLSTSTGQSIDGLTASMNRTVQSETSNTRRSIELLKAALQRPIRELTANAVSLERAAKDLGAHSTALGSEMTQVRATINTLVAGLPTPVKNALQVYNAFTQLKTDLDAVPGVQKTSPEYLKLISDLTATEALAKTVSDSLGELETTAQNLAGEVETFQTDITTLQARIKIVVAAAIENAEGLEAAHLAKAVDRLETRFSVETATAQGTVSRLGADAHQNVTAAQRAAQSQVTSAENQVTGDVAAAETSAKLTVATAEQKVNHIFASVKARAHAAFLAAEQKAEQGGQAALAAAHSSAAQASAQAQKAFTAANNDYAALLAISQQALANELPGGDASPVNEQDGSLLYMIAGS